MALGRRQVVWKQLCGVRGGTTSRGLWCGWEARCGRQNTAPFSGSWAQGGGEEEKGGRGCGAVVLLLHVQLINFQATGPVSQAPSAAIPA